MKFTLIADLIAFFSGVTSLLFAIQVTRRTKKMVERLAEENLKLRALLNEAEKMLSAEQETKTVIVRVPASTLN